MVRPQMQMQAQPPVAQPQVPVAQPQMKGRFDAYTGKENPKFDPETGVQNW